MFLKTLSSKKLPQPIVDAMTHFYASYIQGVTQNGHSEKEAEENLLIFLQEVERQVNTPYPFDIFHTPIKTPLDYYAFGLNFLFPLIDEKQSTLIGKENITRICTQLKKGENVIFFANHQTEADPIAISYLLNHQFSSLAKEMIFVAGHRVTHDPMAIPFSLGRHLLCIYSKRYLDHPPEKREEKVHHNQRAMHILKQLLKEGGRAIYVAPAGGRDRMDVDQGMIHAPFDPQSIEMFHLIGRHAKTATHYYPMALSTYTLLPPPSTINVALGEVRSTKAGPIHLAIGDEIDFAHLPTSPDRTEARNLRADKIFNLVKTLYSKFS